MRSIPSWEDLLEEEMAIQSNILAWIIPQIEEPLAGYIPQGGKESDTTEVTQHITEIMQSNVKRLKLIGKKQKAQVDDFSSFLCMQDARVWSH